MTDLTPRDDDARPERSRRLLLVLGVLGAVSAVIAALVIFSSGGGSPARPEDPQAHLRANGEALLMGRSDAPTKVVVFEDFGGPPSRDFEIGSRDFLRVEAAEGHVLVEYRPFHLTEGYSRRALEAWAAVLRHGTAEQAMRFHDVLFDRQPPSTGALGGTEFEAWAVEAGVAPGIVSGALQQPDAAFVAKARQAARAAGVGGAPTVLVEGRPLHLDDGTELADQLQRTLLED